MRVRVLFFGVLKEIMGRAGESVELLPDALVSDLLARYRDLPRMAGLLPSLAVSVNQEYAEPKRSLHEDDEIALLPPVSGGMGANQRTSLVHDRIDCERVVAAIQQPSDGAVATFQGIVRNQSHGRRTQFLEYEAYEPMAATELEKLAGEALVRFAIREVTIVHRLGRVEIGEASVLIVVASAHRAPAFDACRWLIDSLKQTVPIWKKEYFADGAVWAQGEPFPPAMVVLPASGSGGEQ